MELRFRHHRGDGSSFDTHFGQSEVTEDKRIIEYYIGQCHYNGIDCKYFGTGDADVQCTKHYIDKGKEKP